MCMCVSVYIYVCMYLHTTYLYPFIYDKSLRFWVGINFGMYYRNRYFEVICSYNSKDTDIRLWKNHNLTVETVENNTGKMVACSNLGDRL